MGDLFSSDSPPSTLPPPPPPLPPPPLPKFPFVFLRVKSSFLPDPSPFFSPSLLSTLLPTNSFQNFALNNGDQAEYIHPYLVKPSPSFVSVSFPSHVATSTSLYQVFNANLTISAVSSDDAACGLSREALRHVISSYSDLGVTLDFAASNLKFVPVGLTVACSLVFASLPSPPPSIVFQTRVSKRVKKS